MVDFELKITKVNDISRYSTADRLTQLVESRTTVREVSGSSPDRTNTQSKE